MTTTTEIDVSRFASLRIPVYRRLLLGATFSFLSMMISATARGWLAFDLTGTNTALGGIMIAFGAASIFMIPVGGVLADRAPKRRTLLMTATLQAAITLTLATAAVTDIIAYWMLVVASIFQGGVVAMLGPARLAFIAETLDRDHLTNGVLLSQSSLQFTRVVGPAVAGALIGVETIGIGGVYYIAGACALAGFALTVGLPEGRPLHPPTRSPLADIADGVRFVRDHRQIARLIVLSYLVVLLGFPYIAFLPVVAADIFDTGSTGFGFLTTAGALGALAASLSLANVSPGRVPRLQILAAAGFGLSLVLFAVAPEFGLALALMVVVGATSAAFQSLNNSLVLTNSPVEYHGRVQSLLMLSFSGFGLAALPLGLIADGVGLRETLVAMGVLVVIVSFGSTALARRESQPPASTL